MHRFVTLASEGTCDQLEEVLRGNSLIEQDDMANALSVAVMREDRAIIQLLLDHGAMPNVCPTDHMPPLVCAIEQRNSAIVRLLVEHGADVNEPTETGWTPLHWAVDVEGDCAWQRGEIPTGELISLLLDMGANPQVMDAAGKTPLNLAEEYQHARAIELLTCSPQ